MRKNGDETTNKLYSTRVRDCMWSRAPKGDEGGTRILSEGARALLGAACMHWERNKVRQDYDNVTRSLITTWGRLAIHKLKLNFAWYLCCVSVVCTIVFTNSHSAGRAESNMYRQYMYSHSMPRDFKMAISKHLPEQPYLLSQCQYCSRWRRPTHGK